MHIYRDRTAFYLLNERWAKSDLEGVMALFSEEALHLINVDGVAVPYATSTYGKEDLRQRLQIVLDTFYIDKFDIESYAHEREFTRSVVMTHKTHKRTGERLCERLRFRYWFKDGLIVRTEENHDAPYIEAFQRFVCQLEHAARSA
jgi:ketosteroid isomerase-like protein